MASPSDISGLLDRTFWRGLVQKARLGRVRLSKEFWRPAVLRERRRALGVLQADLAAQLKGVGQRRLSRWEGGVPPPFDQLEPLSRAIGVDPWRLYHP